MKDSKKKIQKQIPTSKTKSPKSDGRIDGKSYTAEDVIFIANKFIQMGLNIQSIVQVMKEESICEDFANANDLQIQKRLQKLHKEKEKMIDFEDLQKKLLKIENIQVAVKYPDVFQISIIEQLK